MNKIQKLLNIKIIKIISQLNISNKNNILDYINDNLLNLDKKKKDNNINNIENKLIYLIENDCNFLIINKNLKSICLLLKNKFNYDTNENEINNILIKYIEKRY